jgi:S-adenosylmethionine-diacylglycerol 3-amino-3-carboxypropyl transferase
MKSEIATHADFGIIRYAQCWEDADILLDACAIKPGATCLSIASAGDNAIAMLTYDPAKVIALDLSDAQIACVAIRVAAYKRLTHGELLELIGSRPSSRRPALMKKLAPELDDATGAFWDARIDDVIGYGVGGAGKFERYFRLFKDYIIPLVHTQKRVTSLLTDKPATQREQFYTEQWNSWRWRGLLNLFFSRFAMGRLGRDPSFFSYAEGSLADQVAQKAAFALTALNPAHNPYLHWILTGTHGDTLPVALREEHFNAIRNNIDRLVYKRGAIEESLDSGVKYDAFNLSDIFEYMSKDNFATLYGKIVDAANEQARIVYWNMMVPRSLPASFADQVIARDDIATRLASQDKAFFYSRFVVEEKR